MSSLTVFLLLLMLTVALRWPLRSEFLYEWDSVQFALGALHFDVNEHRPHPPGYPIWIVLVRGLMMLVRDPNVAQILLGQLFVAGALRLTALLARRAMGLSGIVSTLTILFFSPTVTLYSTVATTYPVDLFGSALVGLLAAELWAGNAHLAPVAAALWALLTGLRQSSGVLLAPLLFSGLLYACGRDVRRWLVTASTGAAALLSWYLPAALLSGGVRHFMALSRAQFQASATGNSIIYGAPLKTHLTMVGLVTIWALLAMGVPTLAALWLRRAEPVAQPVAPSPPSWHRPAFFILWGAPVAIFGLFIYTAKPGYLMLLLPPLALLSGGSLGRSLMARPRRTGQPLLHVMFPPLVAIAAVQTILCVLPYDLLVERFPRSSPLDGLRQSSLCDVRTSDRTLAVFTTALREDRGHGRDGFVIIQGDIDNGSANWRKLGWYLPELPILWWSDGKGGVLMLGRSTYHVEVAELTQNVRRIFWVTRPDELAPSVRAAFPATRRLRSEVDAELFMTELGNESGTRELPMGENPIRLSFNRVP